MKKLRHLWCSHKKYCTTTITPLRSYTPLSGYPYSRSSYDLDRTYYTSTPYTYRNRYQNDNYKTNNYVGELTRHLSDLSIDKIGDSDDDPSKVRNDKKKIKLQLTARESNSFEFDLASSIKSRQFPIQEHWCAAGACVRNEI